jgi:DNA helicase-2/ATP-dependent DNA helicase PcrA
MALGLTGQAKGAMPDLAFSDIAVLFRLRLQAQTLSEALEAHGLPYQVCGEEEITAADQLDFKADKISLLTVHAAKGLEFRLVFLVGLEEGLMPLAAENLIGHDKEEEERLFYVAMTRAKDILYLTRASNRRIFGQPLSGAPSPFLSRIPAHLVEDISFRRSLTSKSRKLFSK